MTISLIHFSGGSWSQCGWVDSCAERYCSLSKSYLILHVRCRLILLSRSITRSANATSRKVGWVDRRGFNCVLHHYKVRKEASVPFATLYRQYAELHAPRRFVVAPRYCELRARNTKCISTRHPFFMK